GTILFDNVNLKNLNYRDVRRHIGMVLQENHMFNETIARNISFGDPEPDLDRILAAAQAAAAHDFIMRLPMGYETKIGESGLAISGGQKQRIAIARDRKSTRLNSSHRTISYAVFCLKKKKKNKQIELNKKKHMKK